MDVHRVNFTRFVQDSPMLISPDVYRRHRTRGGFKLLAVDVEAIVIFGKSDDEIWLAAFNRLKSTGFGVAEL